MSYPGNSLRKELEDCWELDVPAFEYQPLNHDAQEQRFVVLHPCPGDKGASENRIRCTIKIRPLASAGPFITVKDSRGYRLMQDAIEIDGKGLVVSAAAEVFLRYFRGRHFPITLWLRHICLVEFGWQEEQEKYWNREFIDSVPVQMVEMVVNGQRMIVRKNLEQALRTIRQSRTAAAVWVNAVCIDQSNTAEHSRQVARMFDIYNRAAQSRGAAFQQLSYPTVIQNSPGFLEAAILTRDLEATDEQDRIFALWNLARDKNGLEFTLDYGKNFERVYLDFAIAWARQHDSLDIIAVSEPYRNITSFYDSMPSWCPDWSTPSDTSCLARRERIPMRPMMLMDDLDGELYSADGGVAQLRDSDEFFSFDGNILQCHGVILDRAEVVFDDQGELPQTFAFHPPDPDTFYKFQEWSVAIQKIYEDRELGPYTDPLQAAISMFHGDVLSAWEREDPESDEIRNKHTCFNGKERNAWRHYDCIAEKPRHIPGLQLPYSYAKRPWLDIVQA
ncbi:heterokaryon incompatibility protein, partial [Colletotrichum incanum]